MNVESIVNDKLKELGFDGLCRDGCGCGLEDLMSCGGEEIQGCLPAKKTVLTEDNIDEWPDYNIGETIYISE